MALKEFASGFVSGFKSFSHSISAAVNIAVLTVVYFIGVGIVAIFARIMGKKFLPIEKKSSYWVERNLKKQRLEEYKRSF